MIGIENLPADAAADLVVLVNSLDGLTKSKEVSYAVWNKKTNSLVIK